MECPKCGYVVSEFDVECPRCKRLGEQAARAHSPQQAAPVQLQSPQTQLADYVARARAEGLTDDAIRNQLLGAGWSAAAIDGYLNTMPQVQQPVEPAAQNMPHTAAISDTLVWLIAFAPLMYYPLIEVLQSAGIVAATADGTSLGLWLIANMLLMANDTKQLREAGYDTSTISNSWFIPQYLFGRAHLVQGSNGYAFVWIVCFILVLWGLA